MQKKNEDEYLMPAIIVLIMAAACLFIGLFSYYKEASNETKSLNRDFYPSEKARMAYNQYGCEF